MTVVIQHLHVKIQYEINQLFQFRREYSVQIRINDKREVVCGGIPIAFMNRTGMQFIDTTHIVFDFD